MRWYKHLSDSLNDPDIAEIMDNFGSDGYVAFFGILEIMTRNFNQNDGESYTISVKYLRKSLRISEQKLRNILTFPKFFKRISSKFDNGSVTLKCPKLLDMLETYDKQARYREKQRLRNDYVTVTKKLPIEVDVDVEEEVEEEKTMVLNTTIAKPQKKEPVKPEKTESVQTLTPVQQIVEHYKKVGKFEDVPNWDKAYFPRCTKPAKELLNLSEGDIEQVKRAITEIIAYLQGESLSWTLETVVKKFGHWKSGKLIPSKDRRLTGNIEAGRKFLQRGENGK